MRVSMTSRGFTTLVSSFPCIVIIFFANFRGLDGICQWTAPPPAWNQSNPGTADIRTAVIRALNGSTNYNLTWKYTLPVDQSITFTFFSIGDGISQPDTIGYVISGRSTVNDRHGYQSRFRIKSTREFSNLTINTVTEQERATFQCKLQVGSTTWAYNIQVEVTVAPHITHISRNQNVNKADAVNLNCTADGKPAPNITWTRVSDNSVINFPFAITGKQDEGVYRCTADNGVGDPAIADVFIAVQRNDIRLEWPVEKLNGVQAVYQQEYDDLNSAPAKAFKEKFAKEVDKVYANDSTYEKVEVTGLRKGSVIVSFVLYFTTPLTTNEGLAKLRNVINNGTFGPFSVGTLKIMQDVVSTESPYFPPTKSTSTKAVTPGEKTIRPSSISQNSCSTLVTLPNKPNIPSDGSSVRGNVLVMAIIVGLLKMLDPS